MCGYRVQGNQGVKLNNFVTLKSVKTAKSTKSVCNLVFYTLSKNRTPETFDGQIYIIHPK